MKQKGTMVFCGDVSPLPAYLLTNSYHRIKDDIVKVVKRIKHKQMRSTGDVYKEAFNTVVRTWSKSHKQNGVSVCVCVNVLVSQSSHAQFLGFKYEPIFSI